MKQATEIILRNLASKSNASPTYQDTYQFNNSNK